VKKLWNKISFIGIKTDNELTFKDQKRFVFFNQVLFVGFFAVLFQIAATWDFIGSKALIFLLAAFMILVAFQFNKRGLFNISRRFFILTIYALGLYTSTLLGGQGFYHIGVFSTFTFSLILFDLKKEKLEILMGIPFVLAILAVGELEIIETPDFSNHPALTFTRFSNLFSLIALNSIFIIFIIRLNRKTEVELFNTVQDKDALLKEVNLKTASLEQHKTDLEAKVEDRTKEISVQKDILQRQNEEKELLLKEVHHRVKNNLQVIVSLINLQLAKFDDKTTSDALKETQLRVLSMASVHTKMYETSNFQEVTILSYCSKLIENVRDLYGYNEVSYDLNIPERIRLDMETTIPVGLILNEIISNYFKHVLKNKNGNHFSLKVSEDSNTHYKISYHDNGSGFPEGMNLEESNSLGMHLIQSLVEQVDGEFEFFNDEGARYSFTIPKKV